MGAIALQVCFSHETASGPSKIRKEGGMLQKLVTECNGRGGLCLAKVVTLNNAHECHVKDDLSH